MTTPEVEACAPQLLAHLRAARIHVYIEDDRKAEPSTSEELSRWVRIRQPVGGTHHPPPAGSHCPSRWMRAHGATLIHPEMQSAPTGGTRDSADLRAEIQPISAPRFSPAIVLISGGPPPRRASFPRDARRDLLRDRPRSPHRDRPLVGVQTAHRLPRLGVCCTHARRRAPSPHPRVARCVPGAGEAVFRRARAAGQTARPPGDRGAPDETHIARHLGRAHRQARHLPNTATS